MVSALCGVGARAAVERNRALRAAQVTAVLSSVWEIHYRNDISVRDRVKVRIAHAGS